MTYIDTQGMGYTEGTGKVVEHTPFIPSRLTVFTDQEKKELKEIINEVLDEREARFYKDDEEWLYRGTY